jgi:Ca2+/Na+ antiporter
MVGTDLSQHLQHLEEQLAKLMKSYQDYESRNSQKEEKIIPFSRHILYLAAIIFIIITATFVIGSFIVEARKFIAYIAAAQGVLSICFYIPFVKKMTKEMKKEQKPQHKTSSTTTIYELDQQRFAILQELAASPIPHTYITPTAITKMNQLVKSGMCTTIDECTAQFNRESNKQKHEEELMLIQKLQMISYH